MTFSYFELLKKEILQLNLFRTFPLFWRKSRQEDFLATAHSRRIKSHEADLIGHSAQHIHKKKKKLMTLQRI